LLSVVRRRFIAPVSFGLGDLVVSLPVLQAALVQSIGTGIETWLLTRSPGQGALAERIPGLGGTVAEDRLTMRQLDELIDLRDHPLQRDYWWGSPEFEAAYGPMSINEIIAQIAADFGITCDLSAPVPLHARERRGLHDLVLFVSDADGTAKQWPTERWVALADELGCAGFDVAVVTRGQPDHALVTEGLTGIVAPTPGDAVDVLSACRAVIGIDTGLTHIAVQQGTPTVTICRNPAVYYREWDHTRLVAGAVCDAECERRERAYADAQRAKLDPNAAPRVCPSRSRCLQTIEPRMVLRALEELC
jgi:hypothetical protein